MNVEFLKVDGREVEYQKLSSLTKKNTLVLLHEGLGCVELWERFPQKLSEVFNTTIFTYSRFGYGASSPVSLPRSLDYHSEEALTWLSKILDKANISDCILVGHSDGASIALIYAGKVRDPRIKGLVLLSPHVKVEEKTVRQIKIMADEFLSSGLDRKLKKYHGGNTECAFFGWSRCWLDPAFLSWNIEDVLSDIKVPILCVRGRDDPFNTRYHVDSIRNNTSSLVQVVTLEKCGHSPHRESPKSLMAGLQDFISGAL